MSSPSTRRLITALITLRVIYKYAEVNSFSYSKVDSRQMTLEAISKICSEQNQHTAEIHKA
jgi:hypothetical protein